MERKWVAVLLYEQGIEESEKKLKRHNEHELEKVLLISIRLSGNEKATKKKDAYKALLVRNWRLHPLIHTLAGIDSGTKY